MSDSFSNPQDQANLEALKAKLQQLDADIRGAAEQIATEAAALRQQRAEGQRVSREGGVAPSRRAEDTSTAALRVQQTVINEEAASYAKLNEQIQRRIALEGEAAAQAKRTATAGTLEGGGWFAAGRAQQERAYAEANRGTPEGVLSQEQFAAALRTAGAAAGEQAAELQRLTAAQDASVVSARTAGISEEMLAANIQAATVAMVNSDNALTRHGALTTEMIAATARGQIEFREFGDQIVQTIGKFSGWAAAAAAVYGVIGTLSELRHGAVDTQSALTGLTRFIPNLDQGKARQQIVQQAQDTVTPVKDVGDAAQQFARIFKNQGDVFTASHVALTAAKLDNIQLADSYRYLTALVQEWGLNAQQLPGVFDQLTAAQDRLGAKVSQTLPAIARSLSAVKNQGGDLSQLIALESLALVRTGQTGNTIGTGFGRGASNFFPTPASRGTLERYGIDANQGFTAALIDAIQKTSSENLSGPQRQEISKAFFGSLRGGMLAGLFNASPEQLQKFLSETAPGGSTGLANKQLSIVTGQADQQIKELKVNLQALGAELAGGGLSTPFGLMLHALNAALQLSTALLAQWNTLPAPIKEAASTLAVVAGTIGTLRRFNFGGMLAQSNSGLANAFAPIFQRNPEKLLASRIAEYSQGLDESLRSRVNSAAVQQQTAALQLARAQRERAALIDAGTADEEALAASEARLAAAANRQAAALDEYTALSQVRLEYQAAFQQFQANRAAGMGTAAAAEQAGLGGFAAGGAAEGALGGAAAARLGTAEGSAAQKAAQAETGLKGLATRLSEQALAEEALLGETTFVTGTLAGATAGLATFTAGITAFATASVGLGSILVGAFAAYEELRKVVTSNDQFQKQSINAVTKAQTPQQAIDAYNSSVGGPAGNSPTHAIEGLGTLGRWLSGQDSANAALLAAKLGEFDALGQAQNAANANLSQVNAWLRKAATALGTAKTNDYTSALHELARNKALGYLDPSVFSKLQGTIQGKLAAQGAQSGKDPFAAFRDFTRDQQLTQLQSQLQGYGNRGKAFGTTSGDLDSLIAGYAYEVGKYGHNPKDTAAMAALAQAQSEVTSDVSKQVQDFEDLAKSATTNQGQQGYLSKGLGAIGAAESSIKTFFAALEKQDAGNKSALEQDRAAQRQLTGLVEKYHLQLVQDQLALLKSESDVSTSAIQGIGPKADLERAKSTLRGYETQLAAARKDGADAQTVNNLIAQVNNQRTSVLKAQVDYIQQLAQAQSQYAQAGTASPVEQERIDLQQTQQALARLTATGANDPLAKLQLLTQIRQDTLKIVSDQLSHWQDQQKLLLAQMNLGQPDYVQLGNAVAIAQQTVAHIRALGNQVAPDKLIQAQTDLANARAALVQWQIQQGQDLINAQAQLAQAETANPVDIARAALVGAQRLLAYDRAHHQALSTIVKDQAAVAADRKSLTQAIYQQQEQTIQFQAATYQITSNTEIDRLKALYKWMKHQHASIHDLQQVYQEIWNLEYNQGGDLNLAVGDLKMPSTYQVRAAIASGRESNRRKTSAGLLADVKTNVQMNVVISRDVDMHKFTNALREVLGTSVQGVAQAAGLV